MAEDQNTIDNYQLVNCLAQGRHTQVWEATDGGSSRSVALKLLLPEAFENRLEKQGLKYEAKVGKSLDHPNIIKVIDCIVNRKHAYIVMDLFRANNVKLQLRGNHNGVLLRARKLIESTAEAIGHMHSRGWIHKDVKPENILLNKAAEVRLIDFSLTGKPAGSLGKMVNRKKKGLVQGTRTYMAPEQIRNRPISAQTDIYSFGVSIYEVITGRAPFCSRNPDELLMDHIRTTPADPSEFNNNITAEMDQLVLRMLAKDPKNRHESIDEFLTEFRNVRIWKEEVREESALTEQQKQDMLLKEQEEGLSSRVDSRLDAMRSAARKNNPNAEPSPPKPAAHKPVPKIPDPPPAPPAPPVTAAQPPQAMPPQGLPPQGMPLQAMTPEQQYAMQQYAMQQAMQQQAMQHQAYQHAMQMQALQQGAVQQPPGMPQQYPMPGQPPAGQPPYPQQGMPAQPPAQPPVAQQPVPPPQPAAVPPRAESAEEKAAAELKKESEGTLMKISDMDMFADLPDVS